MQLSPLGLVVDPEFGAFPVWSREPFPGVVIGDLPISDEFKASLDAWNLEWEAGNDFDNHTETDTDTERADDWESRGRTMAAQLQREVGPDYFVTFYLTEDNHAEEVSSFRGNSDLTLATRAKSSR